MKKFHHLLAANLALACVFAVEVFFFAPRLRADDEVAVKNKNSETRAAISEQNQPAGSDKMEWWREARFGMFIHWGLYSALEGEWNGRKISGNAEWIMNKAEIPVAQYAGGAATFNPVRFDANAWVRLAKNAGMKYIVITAKHHDGFAMFKSAASSFNIVDATPFKRDPLAELAAACAREGIRFGIYYSQSQDWHHNGGAGNAWDQSQSGDYDAYLDTVAVPQIRELLSNYGKISVLFYDTPRFMTDQRAQRFEAIHALQPGLIVNDRLRTMFQSGAGGEKTKGDYLTPEQFIPANGYSGCDWETCMTMNGSWGYRRTDNNWKSVETLLFNLSDIASKGGNLLLNVGPTAEGVIPESSVERLQAIGAWLDRNGEAIYGTQAGPFARKPAWGRATMRRDMHGRVMLYLHIWRWPANGELVLSGLSGVCAGGRMLKGGAAVKVTDVSGNITVGLPQDGRDAPITIVALDFPQGVSSHEKQISASADGSIDLTPSDADLGGPDDEKPVVLGTGEQAVLSFRHGWSARYGFETAKEAIWAVSAEISPAAHNRLKVSSLGPHGKSMSASVEAWGAGVGDFTTVELGIIRLPAGANALELRSEMDDPRVILIKNIRLVPVK